MASELTAPLTTTDHDLLVALNENVGFMRTELVNMRTQIGGQIADHEARLRVEESNRDQIQGALNAIRWMVGVIGTVLLALQLAVAWYAVVTR